MERNLRVAIVILVSALACFGQRQATDRLEPNEPDSPLIILYKPSAKYPIPEAGTICMRGTVTLRVQFRFDGTIGNITVIKGLPYGATENAIEAAKQIQFLPEFRNSFFMTASRPVSFTFGEF